ncbi:MAG: sigma-54 dependent transcriptional regulator [Bacteroidia bacterium]|nr:sigma-54 dependent transcriptional regulator [Bacteroidia bacterium]
MNREAVKQRFGIVGEDPKLMAALDVAVQVAPTEVTVLVVGENGSGKDVFSKIIHQLSKRKHKPFIAVNCGAIPEGTIDSELFGHEKGSFTSAYEMRKGYFEEASGGVIFLDEIAEMPPATQARLLRVLENGEYLRVGSSKVQKTDVRVVAATNKNLVEAIRRGKFREDLYFRLNTVTIYVPPLRERGRDVELLFLYFADEFGRRYGRKPVRLTAEGTAALYAYHWPGNVRELRNFVERLTVLAQNDILDARDLTEFLPSRESQLPIVSPQKESSSGSGSATPNFSMENELFLKLLLDIRSELTEIKRMLWGGNGTSAGLTPAMPVSGSEAPMDLRPAPVAYPALPRPGYLPEVRYEWKAEPPPLNAEVRVVESRSLSLEDNEKEMILRALQKHKGNRKKAALELGISERTLYRKIGAYRLEV